MANGTAAGLSNGLTEPRWEPRPLMEAKRHQPARLARWLGPRAPCRLAQPAERAGLTAVHGQPCSAEGSLLQEPPLGSPCSVARLRQPHRPAKSYQLGNSYAQASRLVHVLAC